MTYSRYAVYYVPPDGPLAAFGAEWLGWDIARGRIAPQPDTPGLRDITKTPAKYGFHGTLKPPFALTIGADIDDVTAAVSSLAASTPRAICDGLCVTSLGGFLAMTPTGDLDQLRRLAGACVRDLDAFRAPPGAAELARRREAGLTDRQEALLVKWGYPYVMEEFRFHLTLSGRLPESALMEWAETAERMMPEPPAPFVLDQIALCGERSDGRFELLHRYTLAG